MKKGFTLVEILVAVAIFVAVVSVASSLFVQAIRGQRRSLAYQELLDQTSYVMEYMSRSIRMARRDDECATPGFNYATSVIVAIPGAECLHFKNYKDECQYFCLDGVSKKLMIATSTPPMAPVAADFTDLTSPDLTVSSFNINGQGWEKGSPDNSQPLVIISFKIEGREGVKIEIQTSISQRNLDR